MENVPAPTWSTLDRTLELSEGLRDHYTLMSKISAWTPADMVLATSHLARRFAAKRLSMTADAAEVAAIRAQVDKIEAIERAVEAFLSANDPENQLTSGDIDASTIYENMVKARITGLVPYPLSAADVLAAMAYLCLSYACRVLYPDDDDAEEAANEAKDNDVAEIASQSDYDW